MRNNEPKPRETECACDQINARQPKEFWIDQMTLTLLVNSDLERWIAWNKPVEEATIHVIEIAALQSAQKEIEELKYKVTALEIELKELK